MPLTLQRLELTSSILTEWGDIMSKLGASILIEITLLELEMNAVKGCRDADPHQADRLV